MLAGASSGFSEQVHDGNVVAGDITVTIRGGTFKLHLENLGGVGVLLQAAAGHGSHAATLAHVFDTEICLGGKWCISTRGADTKNSDAVGVDFLSAG